MEICYVRCLGRFGHRTGQERQKKVIRNWAEGASGLEIPGTQLSVIIPAPSSGRKPSSTIHSALACAAFPDDRQRAAPCTLQILQNPPQRGPISLPHCLPHPRSPSGSTEVPFQGFAEMGQPLLSSR